MGIRVFFRWVRQFLAAGLLILGLGAAVHAEDSVSDLSIAEVPESSWWPRFHDDFRYYEDVENFSLTFVPYTYHVSPSSDGLNDFPLGIGFDYELIRAENYLWSAHADFIPIDSRFDVAWAVGSSIQWRTPIVDPGLSAFLLYKQNLRGTFGIPFGPVAFPYVERSFERFTLRVHYIPPVRHPGDQQLLFSIRIPIGTIHR